MSDVDDIQKEIEKLQLLQKQKQLEAEKQKALQTQSSRVNEDKLIIEKFHGGIATKAFLPNLKKYAKQELLKLPEDIKLYSKSEPTEANHKVFDSFQKSESFSSNFVSSSYSSDKSVGVELPIGPVKLGGGYSKSSSSSSGQKNAVGNSKSNNEMSAVIYEYIPKGSFDLPPSEIILSKAAERRALRINSLKEAFDFFEEFGAYYPVCTYTVGGIFMCEVRASSKSSSSMRDFETSASSSISSKVNGSIGIGGFGLSGSRGSSSSSSNENRNKNENENSELNIEVKCLNYGPQHVNIEEYRKALDKNKNEWTNIGCHVSKLKPIYELIEDTDNQDLNTAGFFLKVAHIVKNLERSMMDQLKKKFGEKETKFDMELYLSCLSEDIQEMAIEEFTNMAKQDSSNELFQKFEKWMKQIFNNAINQNLDILPKLIDLNVDFKDSNVPINNIYLESESNFAFILYYTDKQRRLNFNQWQDYLECLKELKKKNENNGHYILVNLNLHPEVDNVEDMCLKVYEDGNQKILCYVNQDFLDHHKIDYVDTTLSLNEKIFTYYFEDNVFAEFRNLNELKLTEGRLKLIKENSLKGLSKLESLDFGDNHISVIEGSSFEPLESVKNIILSKNRIQEVNKDVFKGLDSLKSLSLDYNLLKSISSFSFVHLKSLTHLRIGNNSLTCIEKKSFAGLENLKSLYLKDNKISSIEGSSFFELKNLHELDLSNNKITALTDDIFAGLENLKTLDLSNNSIRRLDDKALVPFVENLKTLNIKGNEIDNETIIKHYGDLNSFKSLEQ